MRMGADYDTVSYGDNNLEQEYNKHIDNGEKNMQNVLVSDNAEEISNFVMTNYHSVSPETGKSYIKENDLLEFYLTMVKNDLSDTQILAMLKGLSNIINSPAYDLSTILNFESFYSRTLLVCVADNDTLHRMAKEKYEDPNMLLNLFNSLLVKMSHTPMLDDVLIEKIINIFNNFNNDDEDNKNKLPKVPVKYFSYAIGFNLGKALYSGYNNTLLFIDLFNEQFVSDDKNFIVGVQDGFTYPEKGLTDVESYVKNFGSNYDSWEDSAKKFTLKLLKLSADYPSLDFVDVQYKPTRNLNLDHERLLWYIHGKYNAPFFKELALNYYEKAKEMRGEPQTIKYEVKLFKEIVTEIPGSPIVSAAKELKGFVSDIKEKMETDIDLLKQKMRELDQGQSNNNSDVSNRNLNKML